MENNVDTKAESVNYAVPRYGQIYSVTILDNTGDVKISAFNPEWGDIVNKNVEPGKYVMSVFGMTNGKYIYELIPENAEDKRDKKYAYYALEDMIAFSEIYKGAVISEMKLANMYSN